MSNFTPKDTILPSFPFGSSRVATTRSETSKNKSFVPGIAK